MELVKRRERLQSRVVSGFAICRSIRSCYLHWALVNKHSVELGEGLICAIRFVENDSCNTATNAIRSVGDCGTLDRANSLAKVFLNRESGHRLVHGWISIWNESRELTEKVG